MAKSDLAPSTHPPSYQPVRLALQALSEQVGDASADFALVLPVAFPFLEGELADDRTQQHAAQAVVLAQAVSDPGIPLFFRHPVHFNFPLFHEVPENGDQ